MRTAIKSVTSHKLFLSAIGISLVLVVVSASLTFAQNAPQSSSGNKEFQVIERCKILKGWLQNGVLTRNLEGDTAEAAFCSQYEPYVWSGTTSRDRCLRLRGWEKEGVLTSNLGGDTTEASQCSQYESYAWFGIPSRNRCEILKDWDRQGMLTSNLGGNIAEAAACSTVEPYVWFGIPSRSRCETLRDWLSQGILTSGLGGNTTEAAACYTYQQYVWLGVPNENECKQLIYWYNQGILTSSLNGDMSEAAACSSGRYITLWQDLIDNSARARSTPRPALPISYDRCVTLHNWYMQGTLTSSLGGDLSEAGKCSNLYWDLWTSRSVQYPQFQPAQVQPVPQPSWQQPAQGMTPPPSHPENMPPQRYPSADSGEEEGDDFSEEGSTDASITNVTTPKFGTSGGKKGFKFYVSTNNNSGAKLPTILVSSCSIGSVAISNGIEKSYKLAVGDSKRSVFIPLSGSRAINRLNRAKTNGSSVTCSFELLNDNDDSLSAMKVDITWKGGKWVLSDTR